MDTSIIYQHAKLYLDTLKQKSSELIANTPDLDKLHLDNSAAAGNTPGRKPKQAAAAAASTTPKSRSSHVVEHNIRRLFTQLMDYCGGEDDGKNAKEKVGSSSS